MSTHTVLDVARTTYDDLRRRLKAAGYEYRDWKTPYYDGIDCRGLIVRPEPEPPKRLLCLRCSTWHETTALKGTGACPTCNDRGVPASSRDLVTVAITWHELRVLCMWAESWASVERPGGEVDRDTMRRVVYGIADRLAVQVDNPRPLTLAGEVAQVAEKFRDVESSLPEPPSGPPPRLPDPPAELFYSANCTFWTDDWDWLRLENKRGVSHLGTAGGVPVCPGCGSPGFVAEVGAYFSQAREWEDGTSPAAPGVPHPGYVAMLRWGRNRCFRSAEALTAAWKAAGRPGAA